MAQLVEITINKVEVAVRRDDEADVFVGFCPRFQVYSQGETKDEATEAVASAISLRLITAFDHGRIEKVLGQAGFDREFQEAVSVYSGISVDRSTMAGAPCIAGTRIPVYMVLDAVEYYGSLDVTPSYPHLTLQQVKDAIGFAKLVVECPL